MEKGQHKGSFHRVLGIRRLHDPSAPIAVKDVVDCARACNKVNCPVFAVDFTSRTACTWAFSWEESGPLELAPSTEEVDNEDVAYFISSKVNAKNTQCFPSDKEFDNFRDRYLKPLITGHPMTPAVHSSSPTSDKSSVSTTGTGHKGFSTASRDSKPTAAAPTAAFSYTPLPPDPPTLSTLAWQAITDYFFGTTEAEEQQKASERSDGEDSTKAGGDSESTTTPTTTTTSTPEKASDTASSTTTTPTSSGSGITETAPVNGSPSSTTTSTTTSSETGSETASPITTTTSIPSSPMQPTTTNIVKETSSGASSISTSEKTTASTTTSTTTTSQAKTTTDSTTTSSTSSSSTTTTTTTTRPTTSSEESTTTSTPSRPELEVGSNAICSEEMCSCGPDEDMKIEWGSGEWATCLSVRWKGDSKWEAFGEIKNYSYPFNATTIRATCIPSVRRFKQPDCAAPIIYKGYYHATYLACATSFKRATTTNNTECGNPMVLRCRRGFVCDNDPFELAFAECG